MPLSNQKDIDGSSFVELSQIPLSSLTMDRHSIRGWRNEAGEGGGGRDRSGNWNKLWLGSETLISLFLF